MAWHNGKFANLPWVGESFGPGVVPPPPLPSGLVLFFDPSSASSINTGSPTDGDLVALWKDISGNGKDATQASSAQQYVYKTNKFGSNPGILATSASAQYMTLVSPTASLTDMTIFLLFQPSITAKVFQNLLFGNGPPDSWAVEHFDIGSPSVGFELASAAPGFAEETDFTGPTFTAGVNFLTQIRLNAGPSTAELKVNGVAQTKTYVNGSSWSGGFVIDTIGGIIRANRLCDGYYGPILVFNRSLTDPECTQVTDYLTAQGWP